MPKIKLSQSRLKSKITLNPKVVLFGVIGIFLLVGGLLYSSMQSSTINYIGGGETSLSTMPPRSSTPPLACATVNTFSLTSGCGNDSFRYVSFTCGGSTLSKKLGGSTSCKSYDMWYKEAQSTCLSACPTPPPVKISQTVSYLTPTKPRLYYGLFDGYINLTVTRSTGESINYVLRSYPVANSIELPFTTVPKETLSIKVYASQDYAGNPDQLAMGWISPVNNVCGLKPYMPVDLTNFLANVRSFDPNQQVVSTQCWAGYDAERTQDFNDFVFVWTNVPTVVSTYSPRPSVPELCAQVVGTCMSPDGKCTSYADSCQMAKYCIQPLKICSTTTPQPSSTSFPTSIPVQSTTPIGW